MSDQRYVAKDRRIQRVTLVLSDGRRCQFAGPAQIDTLLASAGLVRVTSIEVGEPQELPPGHNWETVQPGGG